MCKPASTPLKASPSTTKSTPFAVKVLLFVAAACFLLQIGLGELLTGWICRYTSPIYFSPAPDVHSRLFYPFKSVQHVPDMTGKVAIVTGANTGIGYETALELTRAGAKVIVAARSESKGLDAVRRIQEGVYANGDVAEVAGAQYMNLDLASLKSVEKFAKEFLKSGLDLHLLVLNAGVMKSPGAQFVGQEMTYGYDTTVEGFEYHIGVNHIGHALLTLLLTKKLKSTAEKSPDGARIVSVSSLAEGGAPKSGFVFEDWLPAKGVRPAGYEDGVAYLWPVEAGQLDAERHPRVGVFMPSRSDHERIVALHGAGNERQCCQQRTFGRSVVESLRRRLRIGHVRRARRDRSCGVVGKRRSLYHPLRKAVTPLHRQAGNETSKGILWEETERAIRLRSNYKK
ncbi:hypothetical protein ACHAWF_019010 [Thalassiosira exigua]